MRVASVRDLRNHFARVAKWLENGEAVELRKRGQLIGRIAPVRGNALRGRAWPDFATRVQDVFGDSVTPDCQALIDEGRGPR